MYESGRAYAFGGRKRTGIRFWGEKLMRKDLGGQWKLKILGENVNDFNMEKTIDV